MTSLPLLSLSHCKQLLFLFCLVATAHRVHDLLLDFTDLNLVPEDLLVVHLKLHKQLGDSGLVLLLLASVLPSALNAANTACGPRSITARLPLPGLNRRQLGTRARLRLLKLSKLVH